jgi:hypothetical protein
METEIVEEETPPEETEGEIIITRLATVRIVTTVVNTMGDEPMGARITAMDIALLVPRTRTRETRAVLRKIISAEVTPRNARNVRPRAPATSAAIKDTSLAIARRQTQSLIALVFRAIASDLTLARLKSFEALQRPLRTSMRWT